MMAKYNNNNYGSIEKGLGGKAGYGNINEEKIPLLSLEIERKYKRSVMCGLCRTDLLFGVYIVFYVLYLCCGALVFSILETPGEHSTIVALANTKIQFLRKYPNVADSDLEALISEVVKANNRGVSAVKNVTSEPNWSFGQSLFFSGTVVTTIGYGHVTPLSREGKVFCIIYAIFGIPFTLVLLSAFVERLLVPTIWLLQWLNSRLGHLYQPFNIRLIHLLIIVSVLVVMFLLIPAGIFANLEPEWDYLDSFYYCFISLTTIGLGDYIPGDAPDQPYRPIYKILTTGYLITGVTFMMLTLAVFYDIPQLNLGLLFSQNEEINTEKMHLAGTGYGMNYGIDSGMSPPIEENTHRQVVRVRSRHRDDSPSPEEPGPKELRLP